ncbi:hypothetical protein PR048_033521 [Dryococelus australis]|uniref:Uncharacterized protein n=1 Tax=Dryococelus australis TaxID=614101 RepID=A0ABQ9G1R6_9NEOP|nr:hypothetical protein PR048_033521 [Dryococelus australis]
MIVESSLLQNESAKFSGLRVELSPGGPRSRVPCSLKPRLRSSMASACLREIGVLRVKPRQLRATVAERLACPPPTMAIRAQSPAGSPDFRMWESWRTMPLVGESSWGSPASPPPPPPRCHSILTPITLIGPQDLTVKSIPNCVHYALEARTFGGDFSRIENYSRVIVPDLGVYRGCGGVVVRLLDLPPGRTGFYCGNLAVRRRCRLVFSGISRLPSAHAFRRCSIITSLHPHRLLRPPLQFSPCPTSPQCSRVLRAPSSDIMSSRPFSPRTPRPPSSRNPPSSSAPNFALRTQPDGLHQNPPAVQL